VEIRGQTQRGSGDFCVMKSENGLSVYKSAGEGRDGGDSLAGLLVMLAVTRSLT
jgi:hypothetical protein